MIIDLNKDKVTQSDVFKKVRTTKKWEKQKELRDKQKAQEIEL